MYKKSLIIFISLLLLLISMCCSWCNAEEVANVYLSSNKYIMKIGEEVEISLNIEKEKTAAYNVNIYFDNEKLEFVSGPENINVKENRIILVWYDKQGGKEALEGNLEKIRFKAKKAGIASFEISGEFYNSNGEEIQTNFETPNITIGNDKKILEAETPIDIENARLETLAIEDVLLYPAFDADILNYEAEVSEELNLLNILAIPENEAGTVEIVGAENISEGENEIIINVTSPSGSSKRKYTINIHKRNKKEEIEYIEKQEENNKKLEMLYETTKTAETIENSDSIKNYDINNTEAREENSTKSINIIFIIIIILALGIIIYLIIKKYVRFRLKNKK